MEALIEALAEKVAERIQARLGAGKQGPRLLTVGQAAEYLGRTPGAIRSMVHAGKLPVVKLDGRVYLDRVDLDHVIEEAKRAA